MVARSPGADFMLEATAARRFSGSDGEAAHRCYLIKRFPVNEGLLQRVRGSSAEPIIGQAHSHLRSAAEGRGEVKSRKGQCKHRTGLAPV